MYTRTFGPFPGPGHVHFTHSCADLEVITSPDNTHASVEITTHGAQHSTAAHMVDQAQVHLHPPTGTLTIHLPEPPHTTSNNHNVTFGGNNYGVINTGSISGPIVMGNVTFAGNRTTGGAVINGTHVEPITVRLALPQNCTLTHDSKSGDLRTHGPIKTITSTTIAGDILCDNVSEHFHAQSVSGDIRAHLSGQQPQATATTVSGDIALSTLNPCAIQTSSVSGDITLTGPTHGRSRTVSGNVNHHS